MAAELLESFFSGSLEEVSSLNLSPSFINNLFCWFNEFITRRSGLPSLLKSYKKTFWEKAEPSEGSQTDVLSRNLVSPSFIRIFKESLDAESEKTMSESPSPSISPIAALVVNPE